MKNTLRTLFAFAVLLAALPAVAAQFDTTVPMQAGGAATYYVNGRIDGLGAVRMMVDTGSGYLTINQDALATLLKEHRAHYVKRLRGRLANGTEIVVPVYAVRVAIGNSRWIDNVQAAVFPGRTRFILGLNVLKRAAPFIFSTDPPKLVLSNCAPVKQAKASEPKLADEGHF